MEVERLPLSGLLLLKPRVFRDGRGFFVETYSEPRYREAGIDTRFVQDNHSQSMRRTLRGLHYQSSPGQAKLIRVTSGSIYDVAVDIRPDSPTYGQWYGAILDAQEHAQLYVPIGFAHGFCVMSDLADVVYKVSSVYDAKTESGIRWNDPEIGVKWPIEDPILSDRDQKTESFADYTKRMRSR
ncbi:MAG TPA: dTDP-4-dehydrorhamnose 3,5-epimerase [Rhodanobacteraceae bacterium]|nr:dTDP-4-dehydrorhamnose 3,5-epimerase [Rhodanobacteraceae bacterium]